MLTTKFINDPDIDKAANELLDNAELLVCAGHFEAAFHAVTKLKQVGPWQLGQHGSTAQRLESIWPYLCALNPKQKETKTATEEQPDDEPALDRLCMPIRFQQGPAGAHWNDAYLAQDFGAAGKEGIFGRFNIDAEAVLKARLSEACGRNKSHSPIHDIYKAVADLAPDNSQVATLRKLLKIPPLQVDEAAQAIATARIVKTLLQHAPQAQEQVPYDLVGNLGIALVLCLYENDTDTARAVLLWLANNAHGRRATFYSTSIARVRDFLASGICADGLGVDSTDGANLLAMLGRRQEIEKKAKVASPYVVDTLEKFQTALAGTPLAGHAVATMQVLDTPEYVYALHTTPEDMDAMWLTARSLVDKTGRWPIVAEYWSLDRNGFPDDLRNADMFSRFAFSHGPTTGDISPRALIAAASEIDVQAFAERLATARMNTDGVPDASSLCVARDGTFYSYSKASDQEVLAAQKFESEFALESWMLDWEIAELGLEQVKKERMERYADDRLVLAFLPTPEPWDAFAYLHWSSVPGFGAEYLIALGRYWQQKYGAELSSIAGIIFECQVNKPPRDITDALQLARLHDLIAPGMLPPPGIALRHYAAGLLDHHSWIVCGSP